MQTRSRDTPYAKNPDASRNKNAAEYGEERDGKHDSKEPTSKTVYVIFASLIFDLLGFTVILPLLPSLLDYYGQKDQDGLYHVLKQSVTGFRELVGAPDTPRWNSVLFGGLLGSVFSLLQFLTAPVVGALSDVYGRKPIMLLTLVGISSSYVLWALSRNFTVFVLARIVGGLSKANINLSTAIVTDVSSSRTRGKGMAFIGIAFSLGFTLGPMIGALFAGWARSHAQEFYTTPALFALVLSVIDIIYVYLYLQESLPPKKRAKSLTSEFKNASTLVNPVALFRFSAVDNISMKDLKSMQKVGMVYFLYLFFYSGLEFTLTFMVHNRFQYDHMQQGKMFFFIGIIMMLVQGGYVRRLRPGSEKTVTTRSMVILIPAFVLMAFANSAVVLYAGLTMFAFASATIVPCLTTVISRFGGVDQKGAVMGIFRSLGALSRALGPAVASTVYWSCGPQICYCVGGLCLLLPLFLIRGIQVVDA
ncbi:major facilitator superfamily domain-containing protein 10-like [Liolophura sinensis]|uniref:major facilitator superfamily domain-containing protein 10-like n=1 Tax=Liolophura sinensis TaxID=3198878 RepID=UPI0031598A44